MKINSLKIINLPVFTQSGQHLGRLKDFIIDNESQSILEYIIKPSSLIKEFIEGDLPISRGQIIEIKKDRLVVEDNLSSHKSLIKLKKYLSNKKESVALNKQ